MFFIMTGLVLVCGLLVTVFMVKEQKVHRHYVKTESGQLERRKPRIAKDEDPEDSGSDVDMGFSGDHEVVQASKLSF